MWQLIRSSFMRVTAIACTFTVMGALMMSAAADEPAPGKQVVDQFTVNIDDKDLTLRYLVFLPDNLKDKESWPLMLFLHGAGERGDDIELVKKWGPPGFVEERKDFPFILISPQCPADQSWEAESLALLVDHLAGALPVDKQRMYVTGLSMGGYGTWSLLAKHPKLFAAAVPICGGGDPKTAETIKEIPIWAFHGDQDEAVNVEQSREMVKAIQDAGGAKVKLTVYPGVGHNSWSQTYDNQDVYDWLLSHKRAE
jgi:predicted peptidase